MSQWDDTIPGLGAAVITDIGKRGVVRSIRFDSNGDRIVTVSLDDPFATPDGLYVARDFELKLA